MSTVDNISRKRPAPGTSPLGYPQQPQQMSGAYLDGPPPLTDDQFFNWGNSETAVPASNPPMHNIPPSTYPQQASAQSQPQPSNQLARRPMSQVIPRPQPQTQPWTNQQPTTANGPQESAATWGDDIDELVQKAQIAKREAQSKRKQIPPFVLKLHSFLENPKNTDLIRWADDGKSFVVLNEDEFANRLIPELFKHNNYASFVRQLNMYGFHKKVGLSDNSMRASERKAKSPSEYWNPFFRRGYPDLLWLIQKPKNQSASHKGKARGKSEDRDEDEEYTEDVPAVDGPRPRPALTLGQTNNALSQEQFANVQRELMMIRRQQHQITQMLGALKREHDALVDQANDYQNKHSRHEHSINAILTFLATLYNRTLQNHEGAQDVAKIFANTLNQEKTNGSGVIDVDDFSFDLREASSVEEPYQPHKRQRLMITDGTENRASTTSPSTTASPLPRSSRRSSQMARSPQSAHVEEVFDADTSQPTRSCQNYENHQDQDSPSSGQQQQDMMSLIHNANARNSANNTPAPDFSNVLSNLESSSGTPFTPTQRDSMLRAFQQSQRPSSSDNKALVSPVRTNSQMALDNKLASTKHDLDHLAQLQAAQEKSVENLTNLLQPLSPTGSIPGLGDGQDVPPPPLNIDDFLLSGGDYFTDYNNDDNGTFDLTNLNNAAYNTNGTTAGFDFADDGPLFADVDDSKKRDNDFLNVNTYDDAADGNGRIESLASSSEAPSPRKIESENSEWDNGDGPRVKRRRAS